MELNLLNILSLLIIFVSLLFAGFLLLSKSKNYLSNLLIGLFLIINAIDAGNSFIVSYIFPQYPGLGMLLSSTIFFKIPLIYLYILSIIYSDFKLRLHHSFHTLPFLFTVLVMIPRFYSVDFDEKWLFLKSAQIENILEMRFSYLLLHVVIISYLLASFFAIKRYKHLLLENYSYPNLINYKWLFQLISIFALGALIVSLKNVFMFLSLEEAHFYSLVVTSLLELSFISWIVIKALQNPELFTGVDSGLQLVKDLETNVMTEVLTLENKASLDKIDVFMKQEEPYLNASITVFELAGKLAISSQDLSLLINRSLNKHFFDFINEYRIEKAKELLSNPDKKLFTVLEILYDVGFNSKSSFNTAFKKYTNTTPTLYRKQHLALAD